MKSKKKEKIAGYLFLLPALIGFLTFMVYPFVSSIFISFMDWNMFKGVAGSKFIGIQNYKDALTNEYFQMGLLNNLKISLIAVPILLILSLLLAILMNTKIFAKGALRTIYFLPYVTTVTASAMVFVALFHADFGFVNSVLRSLGIENVPGWLSSSKWALATVGIFWIWRMLGYCMLIYLSGLQGVSKTYYEASSIDGANVFQQFKHITFPMVSPTTFFLAITMGIFSLSILAEIQVMTGGGPGKYTYTMAYTIYRFAFERFDMGLASAMAVVFFIIILIITLIQWLGQKHWVNY